MKPSEKTIKLAITMARKSTAKYRVGAVLYNKKVILGAGFNQIKTHPRKYNSKYVIGLHAEQHCLIGVDPDQIFRSSMIVIRLRKDARLGCSKPCSKCIDFLQAFGLKEVWYINEEARLEKLSF